jgi:hypothetical protein
MPKPATDCKDAAAWALCEFRDAPAQTTPSLQPLCKNYRERVLIVQNPCFVIWAFREGNGLLWSAPLRCSTRLRHRLAHPFLFFGP